jgi:hypothetical protein
MKENAAVQRKKINELKDEEKKTSSPGKDSPSKESKIGKLTKENLA